MVTLGDKWKILTEDERRPILGEEDGKEEVKAEIDWIQDRLI